MLGPWIGYLLLLAAAALFYLMFNGWLGGYLLLLALLMPWASLLVSLPALLGLEVRLAIRPGQGSRGQQYALEVEAANRLGLPVRRLAFRLEAENLFSGDSDWQSCRMTLGCGRQQEGFEFTMGDWGVAQGRLRFLRAYDYLGLFLLPLKKPAPARMLARPLPGQPVAGLEEAAGLAEAAGRRGQAGEDYSLRDYQPGDPLKAVHWKLSSKLDRLILRQPEESGPPELILFFELWGQLDRLNRLMDQLEASCRLLLDRGLPCRLVWAGGPDGRQLLEHPVACPADWEDFLWRAGSQAASRTGEQAQRLALAAGLELGSLALYLDGSK